MEIAESHLLEYNYVSRFKLFIYLLFNERHLCKNILITLKWKKLMSVLLGKC